MSDILLDNQVIKVIHSSKQDLESIFNYYKCYPKNIFDTQIAFNFLYNEPNPSYSKLVKKYFDISLKEGSWRTNWLERPLSDEKIEYACNDVKYLIKLYHVLYEQLQIEQKLDWCKEEIQNDGNPSRMNQLIYSKFNYLQQSLNRVLVLKSNLRVL